MNNIPDTPAYTYKGCPSRDCALKRTAFRTFAGHIRNKERIDILKYISTFIYKNVFGLQEKLRPASPIRG